VLESKVSKGRRNFSQTNTKFIISHFSFTIYYLIVQIVEGVQFFETARSRLKAAPTENITISLACFASSAGMVS
jgi:hypothetical protein